MSKRNFCNLVPERKETIQNSTTVYIRVCSSTAVRKLWCLLVSLTFDSLNCDRLPSWIGCWNLYCSYFIILVFVDIKIQFVF